LLLLSCCAKSSYHSGDLPLVQVAAGQNGRNSSGNYTAELIADQRQLEQLWSGLERKFIGSSQAPLPEIDFATEQVLFISMGQQPTAGYRLDLAAERLTFSDRAGIVRVLWQEPQPGSMLAQLLTAPYLVLRLPVVDAAELKVLDQNNRLRGRVIVPR
jgi:hypothetical protein